MCVCVYLIYIKHDKNKTTKKHKLISMAFCFSILFQHVGPLAVARQHDPAGSWTQWFFLASPGTPRCLNAFCGMHPSIFPSFSTCFCCIVSLCMADWRKGCFVSQCQWALFEGLVPAIFNGFQWASAMRGHKKYSKMQYLGVALGLWIL